MQSITRKPLGIAISFCSVWLAAETPAVFCAESEQQFANSVSSALAVGPELSGFGYEPTLDEGQTKIYMRSTTNPVHVSVTSGVQTGSRCDIKSGARTQEFKLAPNTDGFSTASVKLGKPGCYEIAALTTDQRGRNVAVQTTRVVSTYSVASLGTAKDLLIWIVRTIDAVPVDKAVVTLRGRSGVIIAKGQTDQNGAFIFRDIHSRLVDYHCQQGSKNNALRDLYLETSVNGETLRMNENRPNELLRMSLGDLAKCVRPRETIKFRALYSQDHVFRDQLIHMAIYARQETSEGLIVPEVDLLPKFIRTRKGGTLHPLQWSKLGGTTHSYKASRSDQVELVFDREVSSRSRDSMVKLKMPEFERLKPKFVGDRERPIEGNPEDFDSKWAFEGTSLNTIVQSTAMSVTEDLKKHSNLGFEKMESLPLEAKLIESPLRAVAEISIPNKSAQGVALVVLNHSDYLVNSTMLPLRGNKTMVEMPLKSDYIRGMNVFVLSHYKRDQALNQNFPLGGLGLVPIRTSGLATKLRAKFLELPEKISPREHVPVALNVRLPDGSTPADSYETVIRVVDEGVFEDKLSLNCQFFCETTLFDSNIWRFNSTVFKTVARYVDPRDLEWRSNDPRNLVIEPGHSVFSGCGTVQDLRWTEFRPKLSPAVLYWSRSLKSGADGNISFNFQAPKSPTRLRMTAYVIGSNLVGESHHTFMVQ